MPSPSHGHDWTNSMTAQKGSKWAGEAWAPVEWSGVGGSWIFIVGLMLLFVKARL